MPQIEKEMGSLGFLILYMAAGIFGYVRVVKTIQVSSRITGMSWEAISPS
jgi:membrane associated rhomboid family serine protease